MSDTEQSQYQVLARKYRPETFADLVGQDAMVRTLKNAFAADRIAQAFIMTGIRGTGKTTTARIIAKGMNCIGEDGNGGPTTEPCGKCEHCVAIMEGRHVDVMEMDAASRTGVNDIREIIDSVRYRAASARYKIYIIDEVHMLSNSAFNALLKTIEEPPPYIVFIFATTEIHKVPATIRSRCQQFNFRLIPMDDIKGLLGTAAQELEVTAADEALAWIAKEATGSLRDAYTLFDQVVAFSDGQLSLDVIHAKLGLLGLERLNALMTAVVGEDVAAAVSIVDDALQAGVSVERFTIDLADYLRTLLLMKAGIDREAVLGMQPSLISREVRDAYDRQQLELANELVLQLYRDLRYSVNQRFDLELAVSRLVSLCTLKTPHALVREIRSLAEEVRVASVAAVEVNAAARSEAPQPASDTD
ncbi:MAG: DNA polymerase III subunit gamma/tau, partial [Spirochaetales bacterium]|nr:DNA polymerase III subunit gamma/tau [Spirochaetales bacterium]